MVGVLVFEEGGKPENQEKKNNMISTLFPGLLPLKIAPPNFKGKNLENKFVIIPVSRLLTCDHTLEPWSVDHLFLFLLQQVGVDHSIVKKKRSSKVAAWKTDF